MADTNNYAIFASGGKQYKVSPGQKVLVEKLEGNPGDSIKLSNVMFAQNGDKQQFGAPFVNGLSISAKILGHKKDKKVVIFKKRRTKGYTKKQGHRQERTSLLIEAIG